MNVPIEPLVKHEDLRAADQIRIYAEEKREANQFIHRYLVLRMTTFFSIVAFLAAVMAVHIRLTGDDDIIIVLARDLINIILLGTWLAAKSFEHLFAKRYRAAIEEAYECEKMLVGEGLHHRIRTREGGKGLNERVFKYAFKTIGLIIIFVTIVTGLDQIGFFTYEQLSNGGIS